MRRGSSLVVALLVVGVAACSDDGSEAGGDGGSGGGADARASADAPAAFPAQAGLVSLSTSMATSSGFSVGFYKTAVSGQGCARMAEGPCSATTCPTTDVAGVYAVSAGAITATAGGTPLTSSPAADGIYAFVSGPPFAPGTTVAFAAAGADVPAFTADVVMPSPVEVTDPPAAAGLVIDRASARTFSWTPGTGDVYVYLDDLGAQNIVYPLTVGTVVRCVFPSAAGTATIPASMLGRLEAGDATIAITGIAESQMDVATFEIRVRAVAYDFVGAIVIQ